MPASIEEEEAASSLDLGSFSGSQRRQATQEGRQGFALLQALPQSALVNTYIRQCPLPPRERPPCGSKRRVGVAEQTPAGHRKRVRKDDGNTGTAKWGEGDERVTWGGQC